MQTFIIDGSRFSDAEGFYNEVDRVLTKGLDWQTGHNLNAFNDLLYGGFGAFEYEEQIILRWIHVAKSKQGLGEELFMAIQEIIQSHDHIKFELIL